MELFTHAKAVRLKSRHDKFLYADEDELHVTQDRNGSSPNARWAVEPVPHAPGAIRLRSRYGRYLAASAEAFLLGMTGRKVLQVAPAPGGRPDPSVEWEPVKDGFQARFKSRVGAGRGGGGNVKYLRANGGVPPWRNSVTHDVPHRSATQDWVLWDVEIVQVLTPAATPGAGLDHAASALQAPESPSPPKLRPAPTPHEAHHRPTKSHPTPPPHPEYKPPSPPHPEYAPPPPPPTAKPEPKLSKLESSYTFSAALHKVEGRAIHYLIADDNGDVEDDIESQAFTFNGSSLEELTDKLQEETGIDDLIVCTRSPINGKLTPLLLRLPPNNAAMHIVLVRESSKVAETFPFPYGS
ncbi:chromatin-remodeling ATPase INO80-like [Lolium rigidum]|uniref:chromatin-remodeling ATPase INO80-like n=1 Tax=Lolium rigidum TaxID=89674 RepID=UPI001F5D326F|nr:chromatin-remodeling ATPase INO80-like [Lolium rigidum]